LNKRALLLTAATAALLSGPAYAACPSGANWTSITTSIGTTGVDTACANNGAPGTITITTSGAVSIATNPYTTAAITIDSGTTSAPGTVTNQGTISYQGVDNAVGVELLANGNVGGLDNAGDGIINLLGAGTAKTGILIGLPSGNTTGTFTGKVSPILPLTDVPTFFAGDPAAIILEASSTVEVQGTVSSGIQEVQGATLSGDIDIQGSVETEATSLTSTTPTGNYGIYLGGQTNGNVIILPGGEVSSIGAGGTGIAIASPNPGAVTNGGGLTGSLVNFGIIESIGTSTPSSSANASDPEGGPAVDIGANVTGGILNAGPSSVTDSTTSASILEEGSSPALDITTSIGGLAANPITIGYYADPNDPDVSGKYSIVNRGTISAIGEDANVASPIEAISIIGSGPGVSVTLAGGIFNSGSISATSINNDDGSATATYNATAIQISGSAVVPELVTNLTESERGNILAAVSGPFGGSAYGVAITTLGQLPTIINYGSISATASTTTLTLSSLTAIAISDQSGENQNDIAAGSGTIQTIQNYGSISASATVLNNDRQITRAIDLSASTQNVNIQNLGTISGDIVFGSGGIVGSAGHTQNSLIDGTTTASSGPTSVIFGNVYFAGNAAADDVLTIGANGILTGSVIEGETGLATVTVQGNGTLDLLNSYLPLNAPSMPGFSSTSAAPLLADKFELDKGGTLELSISQVFNALGTNSGGISNTNVQAIITANNVSIADNSIFKVAFGSFVSSPGGAAVEVPLISAPNNADFQVSPSQLSLMANSVDANIPFLFQTGTSNLCTQNITGSPIPCAAGIAPATTLSQLDILLIPKVPGAGTTANPGLGLTGYALQLFPYANEALATDNALGAAVVNAVTNSSTAQSTYAQFAPDVSGATRAQAIALTDSATNIVAARQRELNMYANQEGDTTLWGQEFSMRLSQDSTTGTLGYNNTGFGFALGMDMGDPTDGRYGGALTFFSGNTVEKDPVDVRVGSEYYLGTFYTNWRGKGLFLDTQWTAGWGELRGTRTICACNANDPSDDVTRTADGNRPTQMAAGSVSTGAIFNFGGTVITPQFDVDGLTMREDGYTEGGGQNVNGGDGFDLRVQPYYANSARAFLGLDMREDIGFGDFFLQPEIRGGYRYDFMDGAEKLKVNFAGVTPIDQFTITGPDPQKGNLVGTGGLAITTGAWSIGVTYDYLKATSGNTQQDGMVTLIGRI
jgi:Autotransporter beta-domain